MSSGLRRFAMRILLITIIVLVITIPLAAYSLRIMRSYSWHKNAMSALEDGTTFLVWLYHAPDFVDVRRWGKWSSISKPSAALESKRVEIEADALQRAGPSFVIDETLYLWDYFDFHLTNYWRVSAKNSAGTAYAEFQYDADGRLLKSW